MLQVSSSFPWGIAMAMAAFAGPARAQAPAPAEPPSISVQGACSVKVAPDRARLSAAAERESPDVARAMAEATAAYNRFYQDVKKLDLPDAVFDSGGVQTTRIDPDDNSKQRGVTFRASAALQIETSSAERLAAVMRVAAQDGIDNVSGLEAFVSDKLHDRLVLDCLPVATADARAKAQAMLRGLGVSLGEVLRVDGLDGGSDRVPLRPMAMGAPMMRAAAVPMPEIAVAMQSVDVTVSVTFRIDGVAK